MLPVDDADNTIINSALQSGRKLILSDAGKQLILNYPKAVKTGASSTSTSTVDRTIATHTEFIKTESGGIKRKSPALLVPNMQSKTGSLKTNKVIKILSAEEFNKMCAGKMTNNAFKKLPTDGLTSNGSGIRWTSLLLLFRIAISELNSIYDYITIFSLLILRFEALQSNLANLAKVNNNKRAIMNKGKINPVPALVAVSYS